MTILGRGDLAPPRHRRHRRGGRSVLGVLLVLLLVAAGVVAGWQRYLNDDEGSAAAAGAAGAVVAADDCATQGQPTRTEAAESTGSDGVPVALPTPGSVSVRVLNSTDQNGLAGRTAQSLAARGFVVDSVGNSAGGPLAVTEIRHDPADADAAALVALQLDEPQLVADPAYAGAGVDVVLGTDFTELRTPDEVSAGRALRAGQDRATCGTSPRPRR